MVGASGIAIACGISAGLANLHASQEAQAVEREKAQQAAKQAIEQAEATKEKQAEEEPSQPATPRSDWRQGSIPFIYQTDKEWADQPYADATIEKSGCGPTSLSMVYVYFTGKQDMDPAKMAEFSEQNGYVEAGMTSWKLMSDGAAKLGLKSQGVGTSAEAVAAALSAGHPVIVSVKPGTFTKVGHFMVLSAISNGSSVSIHDPNSKRNSALLWDINLVMSQTVAAWAFA